MNTSIQDNTLHRQPLALGQRLAGLSLSLLPPFHWLPPKVFRRLFLILDRICGLGSIAMNRVEDYSVSVSYPNGDIRLRLYEPNAPSQKTLVFFHSGGCVIGSIDTHDRFCRHLAHLGQATVISVDYRLAPEHPFPVSITDALSAWNWVLDHKRQLALPEGPIGVAGDSAGGYLSLIVNLIEDQSSLPVQAQRQADFQMIMFPMLDLNANTPSYGEFTRHLILTDRIMKYFRKHYLRSNEDLNHPLVSPLRSQYLHQCPKTYLLTVGYDPLRDEGIELANQLKNKQVDLDYEHFGDCMHSFFSAARLSPRAKRGVHQIAQALRNM